MPAYDPVLPARCSKSNPTAFEVPPHTVPQELVGMGYLQKGIFGVGRRGRKGVLVEATQVENTISVS